MNPSAAVGIGSGYETTITSPCCRHQYSCVNDVIPHYYSQRSLSWLKARDSVVTKYAPNRSQHWRTVLPLPTSTSTCSTIGLVALLQVTVSPETPPQGQKGSSPFRPHSKQLQHGLNDYTVTAAPPPRDEELFEQNCDLRYLKALHLHIWAWEHQTCYRT
ncbi:hypothetical protein EMCRGX_G001024 [Ephydatia muelleri]